MLILNLDIFYFIYVLREREILFSLASTIHYLFVNLIRDLPSTSNLELSTEVVEALNIPIGERVLFIRANIFSLAPYFFELIQTPAKDALTCGRDLTAHNS